MDLCLAGPLYLSGLVLRYRRFELCVCVYIYIYIYIYIYVCVCVCVCVWINIEMPLGRPRCTWGGGQYWNGA